MLGIGKKSRTFWLERVCLYLFSNDQIVRLQFADREIALRDWLQFKNDRERIRVRNMRLNQAAIVVQAWWRGHLVRLMLGPF